MGHTPLQMWQCDHRKITHNVQQYLPFWYKNEEDLAVAHRVAILLSGGSTAKPSCVKSCQARHNLFLDFRKLSELASIRLWPFGTRNGLQQKFMPNCLIFLLSTTLEQAEAGTLESWGWPWRDPDGIPEVSKKHHQLHVWEQRPGGDVNYYLTSLHLDSSSPQVGSASPVQVWNLTGYWYFFSRGSRGNFLCLLGGTSHRRSWLIPSLLCLNLALCFPGSRALVFTNTVFAVAL